MRAQLELVLEARDGDVRVVRELDLEALGVFTARWYSGNLDGHSERHTESRRDAAGSRCSAARDRTA